MNLDLAGKSVFIGGSSRGIGLQIARAFLTESAKVIISGRDAKSLTSAHQRLAADFGESSVSTKQLDLCNQAEVEKTLSSIQHRNGPLDCVVANAGSGAGPLQWNPPLSEWEALISENFYSAVATVQAAAAEMSSGGSIVLVGSIAGLTSLPAPLPYSAAKAAMIRYAKDLAVKLGPRGIRVNTVVPGNILTEEGRWQERLTADRESTEAYIKSEVPLARFGSPEDISAIVTFLSSPRASFVTGACLVADGGQIL